MSPVNVTVNPDGIITVHFPDGTVPLFHILASVKLPDLITVQTEPVLGFAVVVVTDGIAVTSSNKIDYNEHNNL